jgi:hypothetical protein
VLHTESCKKSQDQFRKEVRIPLWALDLNILGDEPLQFDAPSKSSILPNKHPSPERQRK